MDHETFKKMNDKQAEARRLALEHESPEHPEPWKNLWPRFAHLGRIVMDNAPGFSDCEGISTYIRSICLPDNIVVNLIAEAQPRPQREITLDANTVTVKYSAIRPTVDDLMTVRAEWKEQGQQIPGHVEEVSHIRPDGRGQYPWTRERLKAVEESFAAALEHSLLPVPVVDNH